MKAGAMSARPGRYISIALIVLASCATLYALQIRLDIYKGDSPHIGEFMRLPDAGELKTASIGYELLVADVLWLKSIQHMGERTISGEGYDWIYKALDTVTTLDPQFVAPYEVGGLTLTIVADKVDLSNKLLQKGVENVPDVWQIPYYLGFNYFYFLKDYKSAGDYISMAAHIKGSPSYLPLLASRMYVQAEDPAYAVEFLTRMYESTDNEKLKESIEGRIKLIQSEDIVRELQRLADSFKASTGRDAASLQELVRTGFIKYIPEDPAGGRFHIGGDGRVESTVKAGKLGVHILGKG